MGELRTEDLQYGPDYWNSLDSGAGYKDSILWQDLAFIIYETFCVDLETMQDRSTGMQVLDVGAAFGFFVRHMRRRGVETWGVDFSRYALEGAPEDVREYLHYFDLTESPKNAMFWGDGHFDLLTCFETLEHIPSQHERWALRHLWNALKPGGIAVLAICVDSRPDWQTDPTHVNVTSRDHWESLLEDGGWIFEQDLARKLRSYRLFSHHGGDFVVRKPA